MIKHIIILSPPFYSHFMPLLEFSIGLKAQGLKVTMACSQDFKTIIEENGLLFREININRNRNTGIAEATNQESAEKIRLEEFFTATRKGPFSTLITQLNHRRADTFADPEELLEAIQITNELIKPDCWIVDLLSYGATLSLHCLGLPYITFCPPHPASIPTIGLPYNIPQHWPLGLEPAPDQLETLKEVSNLTREAFTSAFNSFINKVGSSAPLVEDAFSLVSNSVVIYLYPDLEGREDLIGTPKRVYLGSCFKEEVPDKEWKDILNCGRRKILVSFGTFLSERIDVLKQLIDGLLSYDSDALVIVAAGRHSLELSDYRDDQVIVRDFVPQKAIISQMDLVVHHGGCNSFTESLYYSKPMVILPFSSDQFNIAYDAEIFGLGVVIDPNNLDQEKISIALDRAFNHLDLEAIKYWSDVLKSRGANYGVAILKSILDVD
ncbi:MAG: UDP-glucuronosyl/UDP-glucosyltransferase [Fusobacteria bacterium]|nr:MAG: UDP-glucuronosyl/UDP-glucosyltransferase [Fusobacteriota bacterium]KAF0228568.1 MAG: hypothetical protein FD182_824 [Fusobacteriota bacterium]